MSAMLIAALIFFCTNNFTLFCGRLLTLSIGCDTMCANDCTKGGKIFEKAVNFEWGD